MAPSEPKRRRPSRTTHCSIDEAELLRMIATLPEGSADAAAASTPSARSEFVKTSIFSCASAKSATGEASSQQSRSASIFASDCASCASSAAMRAGVAKIVAAGWPAPLLLVYDEVWAIAHQLSSLMAAVSTGRFPTGTLSEDARAELLGRWLLRDIKASRGLLAQAGIGFDDF